METKFEVLKKENVIDFINRMDYGSKVIQYYDDDAFEKMSNAILAYNELSHDGIYQKTLVEDIINPETNEFEQFEREGFFRIYCSNKQNKNSNILIESDLNIFDIRTDLIFYANPKLYKLARKIAKENDLLFRKDCYQSKYKKSIFKDLKDKFQNGLEEVSIKTNKISFHTVASYSRILSNELDVNIEHSVIGNFYFLRLKKDFKPKISPFFIIQSALLNNEKIVRFKASEIKIATLRQYCSNISVKFSTDVKCSANKNNYTVYIGYVSELEIQKEELKQSILNLIDYGVDKVSIENIFNECFESMEIFNVVPEWQQKGFQSEQDYIDHVFDEEIKLKEDFDDINDEF